MKKDVTIKELIKTLQEAINKVPLHNIHTHREFHDIVANTIDPLLPDSVNYKTWIIELTSGYERNIISYDRTFTPYKNSRNEEKGNFSNIIFKSEVNDIFTLKEAEQFYIVKEYEKNVAGAREKIQALTLELNKAKQYLAKLLKKGI